MATAFSSDDAECVTRSVDSTVSNIVLEQIWNAHRLKQCVDWIQANSYGRICLQFPDDLLSFSTIILNDLERNTRATLSILGDTSYGSCCIDEVAASHYSADAIIHFGHACLSKTSDHPVLYVFTHLPIDVDVFGKCLHERFAEKKEKFVLFYADEYFYEMDKIRTFLKSYDNVTVAELAINTSPTTLCWTIDESNLSDCTCVYLGCENQTFFNLTVSIKAKNWLSYDPQSNELRTVTSPLATIWMRRRMFFVEKCKDAQSLGIIVGTLAATGYLEVVHRIQKLARARGIRTYILSVGRVNPSKIANFHEIDCFVFVGCPENNIYTSRDFYKPLLSVFEAEIALNPAWCKDHPDFYGVDFRELLPSGKHHRSEIDSIDMPDQYDISLVTGKIRSIQTNVVVNNDETQIERKCNQMMETSSSQKFQDRSWTGLKRDLASQEPAKIVEGRSGLAMKYSENIE